MGYPSQEEAQSCPCPSEGMFPILGRLYPASETSQGAWSKAFEQVPPQKLFPGIQRTWAGRVSSTGKASGCEGLCMKCPRVSFLQTPPRQPVALPTHRHLLRGPLRCAQHQPELGASGPERERPGRRWGAAAVRGARASHLLLAEAVVRDFQLLWPRGCSPWALGQTKCDVSLPTPGLPACPTRRESVFCEATAAPGALLQRRLGTAGCWAARSGECRIGSRSWRCLLPASRQLPCRPPAALPAAHFWN